MEAEEIDRHVVRAVYELQLIAEDYRCDDKTYKENLYKLIKIESAIENLINMYPNVKDELDKETWYD